MKKIALFVMCLFLVSCSSVASNQEITRGPLSDKTNFLNPSFTFLSDFERIQDFVKYDQLTQRIRNK